MIPVTLLDRHRGTPVAYAVERLDHRIEVAGVQYHRVGDDTYAEIPGAECAHPPAVVAPEPLAPPPPAPKAAPKPTVVERAKAVVTKLKKTSKGKAH